MTQFHSLSRRIVLQFCVFTLVMSALYGVIAFMLMYTLEDSFIEQDLIHEATVLRQEYERSGSWGKPGQRNMQLIFSANDMPAEIRQTFLSEPLRKEFYGENDRHYHLYTFADYPDMHLLAEVSDKLLVRPIRGGVIQFLVIYGGFLTLVACLIAWLLGRQTAKPLRELAQLVDGMSPQDMDKQLPNTFAHQFPNNEIGMLANTLEQTLQRIAQALHRETCFTRDVSHELRTPLAIIKNTVELQRSQKSYLGDESQRLDRIYSAAEQMEKTVHTLLILARESHTHEQGISVALMPLVEQSVLDHHHLLNDKPVEVVIDESCGAKINAQSGMLKVLIDNLISNAFQYTLEGKVSISYDQGVFCVEDTGPGIDDTIKNTVTEPAVKGQTSSGYGFGLSIVTRLCEHQGWELTVGNQKHGGARVLVTLS